MNLSDIEKQISKAKITMSTAWYKKVILPKLLANKSRYKQVESQTGVPAVFIMCLHLRESASDIGEFKKYLGNGQSLKVKTTIVPKGRGPFGTWTSGAIDALELKGLDKVRDWSLARMVYEWERYNGFGYRTRGINTPYVWAGTNQYSKGRFVSDGKFSSESVDKRIGCFALYKLLIEADASLDVGSKVPDIAADKDLAIVIEKIITLIIEFIAKVLGKASPKMDDINQKEPLQTPESELDSFRNLRALYYAQKEIGVKEISGSGSNPQVEKYSAYAREDNDLDKAQSDSVPWCAGFVCYVLEMAGMGSTNSMLARSFLNWGVSTKRDPLPGDLVVFWRSKQSGWQGHVGFFLKDTESFVYVLGGNQDDQVNISRFSKSKILDYRRSSKHEELSAEKIDGLWQIADDIISTEGNIEVGVSLS